MYWDFERENTVKVTRDESCIFDDSKVISAFGVVDPAPGGRAPSAASNDRQEHQSKLPRLPVPRLEDTCRLYLKSLEGLVNAEEYAATEEKVREMLAAGGAGQELQRLLEQREAAAEQPSWLEEFWDDAYLVTRDPIPINVNYFFGLRDHPDAREASQVGRAASLLHAALEVHVQIRDGTLTNDMERATPLCMSQFRRVFCASRVPGVERDSIVCYSAGALTADEAASRTCSYQPVTPRHCVVLVRNRFYQLDVLDAGGAVVGLGPLTAALARVVALATDPTTPPGPPVGVLTTLDRTAWAEAYAQLVELGNGDLLLRMQSAILVVCLDSMVVGDTTEAARLFLHGAGTNRWFDRHNLIVARNGVAGINFEHSVGDGATTLRVADAMVRQDAKRRVRQGEVDAAVAEHGAAAALLVKELQWRLDSSVDRVMKTAFDAFIELIEGNETTVLHFREFGGNAIKNCKLSPDAFVQLAFQLTYYRLFGRNDATYESASTRAFLHGRTETVRSVTRAAADFCRVAAEPLFSRRVGSVVPDAHTLLRNACDAHVDYMKCAKSGCGVDRHLFGLRMMAKVHRVSIPRLLCDNVYDRSTHWSMSTSHCGSTALQLFGFGPVVPDGFGLGYMIFNEEIHVTITSKYTHRLTSSSIFRQMLTASLLEMRAILEAAPSNKRKEGKVLAFQHPTTYSDFEYEAISGFRYKASTKKSLYSGSDGSMGRRGSTFLSE